MAELHTSSIGDILLEILLGATLIWYLQFLWHRRILYKHIRKIPGPHSFPFVGAALSLAKNSGDALLTITPLFESYPGIFGIWFGSKFIVGVSDPKYFDILLSNCLHRQFIYELATPLMGHSLLYSPPETWRRHRKIILPTFNQKVLDGFVPIFSEQSNILVEQLMEQSGKGSFDIFHKMSRCTLDIICETVMGVKINSQTTAHPYSQWINRALELGVRKATVLWYHIEFIFNLSTIGRELGGIIRNTHEFTEKIISHKKNEYETEKRRKTDPSYVDFEEVPKRKAFLEYLIEISTDNNSKLTNKELRDEVTTLIIGGTDTSSTTNSFALIALGIHQELQQKVYDEVIEVVGPDRQVEPTDLPHLKYMERFIKETLRLFPVATVILRDVDDDVDLGDYTIPGGTSVLFGILNVHTNEKYWPNPYRFDPDRFLPEEVAKRHPCCYIPFSYGPRNCIGMKYAMMSTKTLLATVIRKYKITTSYKHIEDVEVKCNVITRPKDGFKVALELRT